MLDFQRHQSSSTVSALRDNLETIQADPRHITGAQKELDDALAKERSYVENYFTAVNKDIPVFEEEILRLLSNVNLKFKDMANIQDRIEVLKAELHEHGFWLNWHLLWHTNRSSKS